MSDRFPARITRNFLKKLCEDPSEKETKQKQKDPYDFDDPDDETWSKSTKKRGGGRGRGRGRSKVIQYRYATAIPVNDLPAVFERVMKDLPSNTSNFYDKYEIQNLIVSTIYDTTLENADQVCSTVLNIVVNDTTLKYFKCKRNKQPSEAEGPLNSSVEHDAKMLERYNEFMNSSEQKKLRSYRNDVLHVWTPEEIKRFKEAFKKYSYGPTSNRKIADYIGGDVHPNHVAYFKHQYNKKLKAKRKREEDEKIKQTKKQKVEDSEEKDEIDKERSSDENDQISDFEDEEMEKPVTPPKRGRRRSTGSSQSPSPQAGRRGKRKSVETATEQKKPPRSSPGKKQRV